MSETAPGGRTAQLLEFDPGPKTYCVDISHVAEVVDVGELTGLPNSPSHVEDVMDLRGKTTTVVDSTELFDLDADDRSRIVDDVDSRSVEDEEGVCGVVKRDDDFAIWMRPTVGNV